MQRWLGASAGKTAALMLAAECEAARAAPFSLTIDAHRQDGLHFLATWSAHGPAFAAIAPRRLVEPIATVYVDTRSQGSKLGDHDRQDAAIKAAREVADRPVWRLGFLHFRL